MADDEQEIRGRAAQVRSNIGLLTEDEMAAILQLNSVETLATWRSQKRGPQHVKLGKRVFYSVNSLGEWVARELNRQLAEKAA